MEGIRNVAHFYPRDSDLPKIWFKNPCGLGRIHDRTSDQLNCHESPNRVSGQKENSREHLWHFADSCRGFGATPVTRAGQEGAWHADSVVAGGDVTLVLARRCAAAWGSGVGVPLDARTR